MSSVSSGVASPGRPAKKTEAVRKSLHTHLRKTAQFIKILDTLVIIFAWIAAMLAIWLAACVVDHWLYPLPTLARWAIWSAAVAGTAAWVTTRLVPLLVRRINPVYAARRIENLVPEFKNGLVSWLELESIPENGVPRGVMAALTYRAARFIGGQDPSATVDTSHLIKLIGGVLLLTTALVVYTMVSPKSTYETGKRIAMPWASLPTPTRIHILEVTPGDIELTQGKPLKVEVELRGLFFEEPVFVAFNTLDGQLADQRVRLDAASEGLRYTGTIRTTPDGVEHELDYWIEAGDARSGPYRVTLNPLPTVALENITLEFPDYTKLAPRVVASGSEVEAVEGTHALIQALANQPISRGKLEVNPEVDADGELIRAQAFLEMKAEDRKLEGEILLRLNANGDNPSSVGFRIRGYNARGDANPRAIVHSMSVFADVAPEITLLGPESRVIRVTPGAKVNLEVRANDPDFGLTKVLVEIRKNSLLLAQETLLAGDGVVGRQVKSLPLNLAALDAKIGDEFQIMASALDNRHDPISNEPSPNRSVSEPLLLQVVGPDEADAQNTHPADEQGNTNSKAAGNENENTPPISPGNPSGESPSASDTPQPNNGSETANSNSTQEQSPAGGNEQSDSKQSESGQPGEQPESDASQQGSPNNAENPSESSEQNGQQSSGSESSGSQSSGSQSSGSESSGSQSQAGEPDQAGGSSNENAGGSSQQAGGNSKRGTGKGSQQDSLSQQDREAIERVQDYMNSEQSNGDSKGQQGQSAKGNENRGSGANDPSAATSNEKSDPSPGSNEPSNPQSANESSKPSGEKNAPNSSQENQGSKSESESGNQGSKSESGDQGSKSESGSQGSKSEAGSQDSKSESGDQGSKSESGDQGSKSESGSQGSKSESGSQGSKSESGDQGSQSESGSQGSKSEAGDQGSKSEAGDQGSKSESGSQGSKSESGSQGSKSESGDQGSKSESGNQGSKSESGSQGSKSESGDQGSKSESGNQDSKSESGDQGSKSEAGDQGSKSESGDQGSKSESGSQGSKSEAGSQGSKSESGDQGSKSESGSQGSKSESGNQGSKSESGDQGSKSESGSQGSKSESGNQGSKSEAAADSQPGSQAGTSSAPSSAPSNNPNKAGTTASGGAPQGGSGGESAQGDSADKNYAEKTTELVLDYLNRQKDQPDPELLRELNWTEADFQNFLNRWNEARDLSTSENELDRLRWQQQLQDLGLTSRDRKAMTGSGINDAFRQQQDGGTRIRPPQNLGKQFEAFQRALQALEP